ncbi:MAG: hypothetical protein IT262_09905 [Saprospiraceae bacterium]|nr:hypothetical protein [Saprospiraceae bacterium]
MACHKIEDNDSVVRASSIPFIAIQNVNSAYVYGQGQTSIYSDIPDVLAIAVDSVVGFEGGYGGKTGSDSIKILKSEIVIWPDTVSLGGKAITVEKFNKSNFKTFVTTNIVIAGPIANPGPTAMEGGYLRAATGVTILLKKVFDGVYVIDNAGGANVAPFPYLLYNYKSSSGTDSLAFPIQPNECGGGLQLVGPTAPFSLRASDYATQYPPIIASMAPVTLQWRVFTFSSASNAAVQPGNGGLCTWGVGVRTFVKQ